MNPLTSRQERLQQQIDQLVATPEHTEKQANRLEDLKDTLAFLSGLDCASASEVEKRLWRVDEILSGGALDVAALASRKTGVSAEALYVNRKIMDLVSKAETEQLDYRRSNRINVFFGPEKFFSRFQCSVLLFNIFVLVVFSVGTLHLLYLSLKRQLRMRS